MTLPGRSDRPWPEITGEPAPRGVVVHIGPKGGGRTECGRSTEELVLWATAELLVHDGILPARRRCQSCVRAYWAGVGRRMAAVA